MLCLYVQAPFAVFRTFTAGSFRPTADFITPSAAYGLLLNIAGIEMRKIDEKSPMTLIQTGLPQFKLALGGLRFPAVQSIYQQLHNYPVGNTGKEHATNTKGNKYNITPVRRNFLHDIKAYICMDGNPAFEASVLEGLSGGTPDRYGTLFLGDNNFLPDKIEPVESLQPSYWYERITEDELSDSVEQTVRLTCSIDRKDMSQTRSELFRPTTDKTVTIPENAWVEVGY